MNITHRIITATAALAAALVAHPSIAGLRQWEPSDYIQDNLVLHYDGIRNAGLAAAHDPAATTWKDLSPSAKDATFNTAEDGSAWTADGYSFGGGSYATASGTVSLGTVATVQAVTKTTIETLRESEGVNGNQWSMFIGGKSSVNDACNIYYNKGNKKFVFKNANGGNADLLQANWDGRYLTAIRNGNDKYLFSGAALPSAPAASGSQSAMGDVQFWLGSADGGSGSFAARYFKGPLNAVRLYSRVLDDGELAWNRALDEARFYGAASVPESALCASAVPDAVVATSVAGANGAESGGCYVVDDDGHTFRAAPFATVGSATYACTGYTLAAWDEELAAWGSAVAHDGEFACFVAPGDKVKITWQWKTATGALDVNPYVTDGLVLHYDGIWNAGFGAHDASATIWKDLSSTGNDAAFVRETDGGSWIDNAYNFETNGYFITQSAQDFGDDNTIQAVLGSPYTHLNNTWPFIIGSSKENGNFYSLYPSAGSIVALNVDGVTGLNYSTRSTITGWGQNYVTAMMHETNSIVFQTTAVPEFKVGAKAYTAMGARYWTIGAPHTSSYSSAADRLARRHRVPFHAIRVYNRLLTDAQLAQNRAIDEARFFGNGVPATGAVVVQSAIAGLEGREPSGIYFPDGWTFSAGAGTQTARGIEWQCVGYQLQTWDADASAWGAQTTYESSSYTSPAVPFASVRLTWLWEPVSGVRTAADYALADYATGGMQLHLDGLLNAGAAHDFSATVWSDLSGNGRDATLAVNKNVEAGNNHWTDEYDGYFFASNAVFATSASFSLGHAYTMQVLGDVNFADNHRASNVNGGTFVSPIGHYPYGSVWLKSDSAGTIQHRTGDTTGTEWDMNAAVVVGTTGHASYLTALRNGKRTALVEGTAYPATENTKQSQACIDWSIGSKDEAASATQWGVGAATAEAGGHPLYGTVKSVRLYDRMLSEDELAWNRNVDSARYFGALAATNVVVVANEFSGLEADTAYEVFGAHTFAASPSSVDGSSANFVRVQALQSNGTWMETARIEGGSYDYTPAAGTVRIEFRKSNPFVIVVR